MRKDVEEMNNKPFQYLDHKDFKKLSRVESPSYFLHKTGSEYYWIENEEYIYPMIRSKKELLTLQMQDILDLFIKFEVYEAIRVPKSLYNGYETSWGNISYLNIWEECGIKKWIQTIQIYPDCRDGKWVEKLAKCISLITEDMINAIDDVGDDA